MCKSTIARFWFFLIFPWFASCSCVKGSAVPSSGISFSKAENKPIIVLDPGHGGLDLGTKAKLPYLEEKKVALTTALLVRKYLDHMGYKVVLTRASDIFVPLPRRVELANHSRASLFVSLHFNSSKNEIAQGIEIFYCNCKKDLVRAKESKKLASSVLQGLIERTRAKSRGIKIGNFYVIRESKIPAILIEGGFISNSQERKKLREKSYLVELAKAVAQGIDQYLNKSK